MRSLERRLRELEQEAGTGDGWRAILDSMGDGELLRLEWLIGRYQGGTPIEDMSEDDQRFLADLQSRRIEA